MTAMVAKGRTSTGASTWVIVTQVRKSLARFVLDARESLEDDFARQLKALGIYAEGTEEIARSLSAKDQRSREAAAAVIDRAVAGGVSREQAFGAFIEDCAFTFLNRLVGLRCLEERGMLLVEGKPESAVRRDPRLGASSLYFRIRNDLPDDASPRDVWWKTLETAFRAVSERVGVLFNPDSEYGRLLPLQPVLSRIIDGLNASAIPSETWAEDEVLGWIYQYYNTDEKDAVYDKLGNGGKIERPGELAAATCLYTERYMVDFLLQNTLGGMWAEMHPATKLVGGWSYYVRTPQGQPTLKDPHLPDRLRDLTLLDPACGSGHFLARAFDLLVQMYREEGIEDVDEIPHLIIERNLHGIDIDLRAVQISALRLYLKACEFVGPTFRPRRVNLVSADVLLPARAPGDLLVRARDDLPVRQLMEAIWSDLADAAMLGSLLHPERRIEELLSRRRSKGDTLEHQDDQSWERFKFELLKGIREEFEKEAHSEDIGRRLFGQDLARGITLFEALSRRYDIVVTNPPYAGSTNLAESAKRFVEREYRDGKRDLYAAFILRNIEFARMGGMVGMVTQQSWLFLRSFAKLRQRVLNGTNVTALAHLGARGFEEIGGEVVSVALFILRTWESPPGSRIAAFRLIGAKSSTDKDRLLRLAISGEASDLVFDPQQVNLEAIPEMPFVYWLRPRFFELLQSKDRLQNYAHVRQGLTTADDERFVRYFWEVPAFGVVQDGRPVSGKWFWFAKGGRYQKWAGLERQVVDWKDNGQAIKDHVVHRYPYLNGKWQWVAKNSSFYFKPGLTFSAVAGGHIGARRLNEAIFSHASHGIFPHSPAWLPGLAATLNSRAVSFILRVLTPHLKIEAGYVASLPVVSSISDSAKLAGVAGESVKLRLVLVDPVERIFRPAEAIARPWLAAAFSEEPFESLLHTIEGWNEVLACESYALDADDIRSVTAEVGVPSGWHPLISGYDMLPPLPDGGDLPDDLMHYFSSIERKELTSEALQSLKDQLERLYRSGPGTKVEEAPKLSPDHEDSLALSARTPTPAETFLEELSAKLGIHPVSVYRILEEMREQAGLVSPPLMKDAFENRVSVCLLLLLGYRWPEQDVSEAESGSAIDADLVDSDGIIPLVACDNHPTASERIRAVLERHMGENRVAHAWEGFRTWVGRDVPAWLQREFFRRHVQQFKQRPIAWHLTSPEGTFQVLVLYHKLSRDTLQRLRDVYAGALLNRLKAELDRATGRSEARAASELRAQIEDVQEFRDRILAIEVGRELRHRIRCRWKGENAEGRPGPYAPDLDDGVKVNIRPFQDTGLLAREVIKKW
jgi:hypothetical protein